MLWPTAPLPAAVQGAVFGDLAGSPVSSQELAVADAEAAVAGAAVAVVPHAEPSRMARKAVSFRRTCDAHLSRQPRELPCRALPPSLHAAEFDS